MPRPGELIIRLKHAKGILGDEFLGFGKGDMFANLSLGGEKRRSKTVVDGGADTVWDEDFSFKIAEYVNFSLYESLKIYLYDEDSVGGNSRRGTVSIDIKTLLEEHKFEVPDKEYPVVYHTEPKGVLVVGISFIPTVRTPSSSGRLNPDAPKKEEDDNVFEHLIHKIQGLGHKPKPKTKTNPSGARARKLTTAAHTEGGSEEAAVEEVEAAVEEVEEHRGWSSESEYDEEYASDSSG